MIRIQMPTMIQTTISEPTPTETPTTTPDTPVICEVPILLYVATRDSCGNTIDRYGPILEKQKERTHSINKHTNVVVRQARHVFHLFNY
mgnify:CR=1 FL=1